MQSEFSLQDAELKALLAVSLGSKTKKKKKAAKKDGESDPAADDEADA